MLHCTFTGPQTPPWFQDQTAKLMAVGERRRTRAEPVKLDPEVDRGDYKTELKDRQVTMDVLRVAVGPWCTQVERWHRSPQTAEAGIVVQLKLSLHLYCPCYYHVYDTTTQSLLKYISMWGGLSIGRSQMRKQHEGLQSLWLSACLEISKFSGRALEDVEFVCLRCPDSQCHKHGGMRGPELGTGWGL